jgi:hypothetical protein
VGEERVEGVGEETGGGMVSLILKICTITTSVRGEYGFMKLMK